MADGENFDVLKMAAEAGEAKAQFELGKKYNNGDGVAQDNAEAAKWYRKAAEQGHVGSQYNLALIYSEGEGVAKDCAEAAKWWRKAAEQGDAGAQTYKAVAEGGQPIHSP